MVSCVYKMDCFTAWRSSEFWKFGNWDVESILHFPTHYIVCIIYYNFNIQYIPSKIYIDERSADPHESFTAAGPDAKINPWRKGSKSDFWCQKTN